MNRLCVRGCLNKQLRFGRRKSGQLQNGGDGICRAHTIDSRRVSTRYERVQAVLEYSSPGSVALSVPWTMPMFIPIQLDKRPEGLTPGKESIERLSDYFHCGPLLIDDWDISAGALQHLET